MDDKEVRTLIMAARVSLIPKAQDIENTELTSTIWTGIIPVRKVTGPPQPSEYCPRGSPPEHVRELAQIGTE